MDVDDIRKSRKKWVRMSRIIEQEGSNARTSGDLFQAVVQAVLLFILEMWEVTPPPHQKDARKFSPQGGPPDDR